MKHITHAVLLGMLAAALLLLVQTSAIPQGVMLLISGVLFGLSCAIALAAVFFMPELPRLTREKGRTPPHFEMWAFLIFYLADGILLFMDAYGFLEQGLPVRFAAASAALSFLAACMAVASERMRICWNEGGLPPADGMGQHPRFPLGAADRTPQLSRRSLSAHRQEAVHRQHEPEAAE